MTSGLEDIFMCMLAISASSLRKCLFESFAHFKIVLFIFLLLSLSCSLHILDTNLLWGIWFDVNFIHSMNSFPLAYGILKRILFSILNDIQHYWQRICHPMQDTDTRDTGLIPGWARSPGGGNDNLLQCWPGKFHEQKSLASHSPWGGKELDTTEHACAHACTDTHTHQLI